MRLVSLYKNQIGTPAKRDAWNAELPIGSTSDHSLGIKCSHEHIYVKSTTSGKLIALPLNETGKKHGQKPPTVELPSSVAVSDFDVSPFDDELLVVAYEDSRVTLSSLRSPSSASSVTFSSSIQGIKFHPHASGLLLSISSTEISLLNQTQVIHCWRAPAKPFWDACFSTDGQLLVTSSKDGVVALWDARHSGEAVSQANNHNGLKPIKLACVGDYIFSTGFSRTRDREFSLYDQRNFSKPLRTQRVDTNTGPLFPLVDHSRNIVYLAGKGDMALRWTEINSDQTFTEGGSPLPIPILGAALAPLSVLDIMKTEINRIYVSSKDGNVVAVPLSVPRRQYLDFHSDLYPPVRSTTAGCNTTEWLGGSSTTSPMVQVTQHGVQLQQSTSSTAIVSPPAEALSSIKLESDTARSNNIFNLTKVSPADISSQPKTPVSSITPLTEPSSGKSAPSLPIEPLSIQPVPQSQTSPSTRASDKPPQSLHSAPAPLTTNKPGQRVASNIHWSRNFLIGKTPLKPDYEGLSGLSTVTPPEMLLLKANPSILVFPLSGAGGRLAVHPTSSEGRFPTRLPGLVTGASITSFELDPFDQHCVYVACDDSKIRKFHLPTDLLSEDYSEVASMLSDSSMDRVTELVAHPSAPLLLSVSEDRGSPTCRIWDTELGTLALTIPIECQSIFTSRWSPDGSKIAVASKDKKIRVVDPRNSLSFLTCSSHDSARLVRLVWLDDKHIITTGFNRTATRELILYTLTENGLEVLARQSLDVSPAPLFPFFDVDTSILFLYAKGERTCLCYEIKLDQVTNNFVRLPSFDHHTLQLGLAFLPKRCVDVEKVEIAVAFRLSAATVERVAFSVPRARLEFFQDDVYVPTINVETPATTAEAWLSGTDSQRQTINLNTSNLPLLSDAPATQAQISTRSKIAAGPQLTESQKQQQHLDRIYQKAQAEASDSEEEVKPSQVPDDDDW